MIDIYNNSNHHGPCENRYHLARCDKRNVMDIFGQTQFVPKYLEKVVCVKHFYANNLGGFVFSSGHCKLLLNQIYAHRK